MDNLFKIGNRIAKMHQEERPPVKVLPSGTRLVPVKIEVGVWAFRKVRRKNDTKIL